MPIQPPIALQNPTEPDGVDAETTRHSLFSTLFEDDGGVGLDAFQVTETSPASMAVTISIPDSGATVLVPGTRTGAHADVQGPYLCFAAGDEDRAISPNGSGETRHDLVVAQVFDSFQDVTLDDTWDLRVVEGVPDAVPSDPAVPDDAIVLARVVVGPGVTEIENADIVDLRGVLTLREGLVDLSDLDDATSLPTAGTLVRRDGAARFRAADPDDDQDVATKGWTVAEIGDSAPETVTIVDAKGATADGGTFISGAWRTRDLNTIRDNANKPAWITLESNVITLESGIYRVSASAPAMGVNDHVARWRRVTATAATILSGTREDAQANPFVHTRSFVEGPFTVPNDPLGFELQHHCETSQSTDGFGSGAGSIGVEADVDGAENVFSVVTITRLGDAS